MTRSVPLLIALLLATPLAAADRPARHGDDGVNLSLTLTLTEADGARTVRALSLEDQHVRLNSGWRMPTVTRRGDGPQAAELQYQDVGLGVTARARRVGPGRIRADGELDLSSVSPRDAAPAPGTGSPVVSIFRQRFDVIVDDGVPATLGEMPRLDGGLLTLTLTATVED